MIVTCHVKKKYFCYIIIRLIKQYHINSTNVLISTFSPIFFVLTFLCLVLLYVEIRMTCVRAISMQIFAQFIMSCKSGFYFKSQSRVRDIIFTFHHFRYFSFTFNKTSIYITNIYIVLKDFLYSSC